MANSREKQKPASHAPQPTHSIIQHAEVHSLRRGLALRGHCGRDAVVRLVGEPPSCFTQSASRSASAFLLETAVEGRPLVAAAVFVLLEQSGLWPSSGAQLQVQKGNKGEHIEAEEAERDSKFAPQLAH